VGMIGDGDGDADEYIGQAEKEAQKIVQKGRSSYQPQQTFLDIFTSVSYSRRVDGC